MAVAYQQHKRRTGELTWPATASPSARRDVASQTWEQIWNAAMAVGPWRAASDAASVTQNVTATTLASRRNPAIHGYYLNSAIKQHLKHKHWCQSLIS